VVIVASQVGLLGDKSAIR